MNFIQYNLNAIVILCIVFGVPKTDLVQQHTVTKAYVNLLNNSYFSIHSAIPQFASAINQSVHRKDRRRQKVYFNTITVSTANNEISSFGMIHFIFNT